MSEGLDPVRVDKVLRELRPNALDYLRVFYEAGEGAQFLQCARKIDVTEATYSRALHDLDAKFKELTGGVPVLRRISNGWALTTAGVQLGERLAESRLQLYEAFDEASESLTVRVRLANDCWREYRELAESVAGADLTMLPLPVRSTGLRLHEPSSPPPETLARGHGLYTTCQDTKNLVRDDKGRVTLAHMPETEVIVTRVDDFKLLLRAKLFGPAKKEISHAELVASGLGLLLPEEGAVVDYLNLLEPKSARSRVRRYSGGTDFEHCRGALLCGSYPRAAMIVHGRAAEKFSDEYTTLLLTDLPTTKAVSGFYRRQIPGRQKPWPNETEQSWITLWSRANSRWSGSEWTSR